MKKTFFIAMMLCCMVGVTLQAQETVGNRLFSFKGSVRQIDPKRNPALTYIKNTIDEWRQCKTGTITANGTGICVQGNRFGHVRISQELLNNLQTANANIVDIHITEQGKYIILLNDGSYRGAGLPEAFVKELKRYTSGDLINDQLASACLNDKGDWVIVSDRHYSYSGKAIGDFLKKAVDMYGTLRSVSLTDNGIIACCEIGVYYDNIPSNLAGFLHNLTFKPIVIKFTDNGQYLITDGISRYEYYL